MINVIASVKVKSGKASEFIEMFKSQAVNVRKEKGCIDYFPAVDVKTDFPPQVRDEDVVTIIERWESMDALMNHLATPALRQQQENEKHLVEDVVVKVLQEA